MKSALEILPRLNHYLRAEGYLFVLGHMRSYSSLLAHILGSHPAIAGYAEMHQKYRNVLDLLELSGKVERSCDKFCAGRHVLDKILHPQVLADRVLRRQDVRVIAIAREPEATVSSILAIRSGGIESIDGAIDYYVDRMETLVRVTEQRNGDVAYLDGEAILEDTEPTLRALSEHLRIAPTLRSEYSTFRLTGVPKYGDPSEWIKAGRVVQRRAPLPGLRWSDAQAHRARDAYDFMRAFMRRNARAAMFHTHPVSQRPRTTASSASPAGHAMRE